MKNTLEQWFFWFWVKKFKVSILLTFLIILYWIFSLYQIPKESSPDIKFGIIWVTTIYTWVDPTSIDDLITSKIEKEIKDLEWIKKITSNSSLWVSSITVELDTWVNTRNLLTDIKDKVDKVSLPSEAEDPSVYEISTENELLFSLYLYAENKDISVGDLYDKATDLKNYLEWKAWITKVDISPDPDYEIIVSIDKNKLENLGLSLSQISNIIKSYNKNTPIWNYEIGDKKYDFRFEWEYNSIEDIKNTPIISSPGNTVFLSNIAEVKKIYKSNDKINEVGFFEKSWYNYVELTINKKPKISIFDTSKNAKTLISEKFQEKDLEWYNFEYVNDLASNIIKDYKDLAQSWVSTIVLVFIMLFIFLWFKESVVATVLIPIVFLVTFIVLNIFWYSLNFLTNFSLLLTLWIALDTIIVIVEWASEKLKNWYTPKTAVLLTVKEFKAPLIAWNLTTLVVFLPMMTLPGIMWKFLSYIPITVFITLLAGLVLSLTINSALFLVFNKNKKYYIASDSSDNIKTKEEIELLKDERAWKIQKEASSWWIRYKIFWFLDDIYYHSLKNNISKGLFRASVIFIPLILLVLSFVFISPKLGFTLFPATDNTAINISVGWSEWYTTEFMKKNLTEINQALISIPEIKIFSAFINGNKISVTVELFDKNYRDENNLRNSFLVEGEISEKLKVLQSQWLTVESSVQAGWPPWGSPVWIKLIANTNKDFSTLVNVSDDFEKYLSTVEGTKNVKNSSNPTPGQFVFKINNDKISQFWLTPSDVLTEIYFLSSWIKTSSIKGDFDDHDIIVKISDFENKKLSPSDIMDFNINSKAWVIKIWNIATYQFLPSISTISREDGNIVISVNSDLEDWYFQNQIQPKLLDFASKYNFPKNITYSSWWEASENAELITSTITSFFIAVFLIFWILVFQFNSYMQPAIVLYSIVLALLWVNIWLYVTGNPYSMSFAIWFIALTWIVVNNAIILIDKINFNLSKWVDKIEAVAEAWKSRLRPIILTTLTTTFGILPLALQDEFWAWLWYTIIFGLVFSTVLTLYVTPSLYYRLFLIEKKEFFIKRIWNFIKKHIKKQKRLSKNNLTNIEK